MVTNVKIHWYIVFYVCLDLSFQWSLRFWESERWLRVILEFDRRLRKIPLAGWWPWHQFKSPLLADRDAVVVVGSFCSKVVSWDLRSWVLRAWALKWQDWLLSMRISINLRARICNVAASDPNTESWYNERRVPVKVSATRPVSTLFGVATRKCISQRIFALKVNIQCPFKSTKFNKDFWPS